MSTTLATREAPSILSFFGKDSIELDALAGFLNSLDQQGRLAAIRQLGRKHQSALFEATKPQTIARPLSLEYFVPPKVAAMREVIHDGRNTLPAFNNFQKRFCRPENGDGKTLYGYNEQAFRLFTGPGYYLARTADDGEVVIDYHEWPTVKPDAWPKIIPNSSRLGRFVYYKMRDYMRRVSDHVTIGRAVKKQPMDAWFVLCRDDVS